jgi:hypothetical protein
MSTPKLLEAIAELESQRSIIDSAIVQLRLAYAVLNGTRKQELPGLPLAAEHADASPRSSFVSEAVEAIEGAGKSLHLRDITRHIANVRGDAPAPSSVGASLVREEERAKKANRTPRIIKVGPNVFDVPRQQPLQITN